MSASSSSASAASSQDPVSSTQAPEPTASRTAAAPAIPRPVLMVLIVLTFTAFVMMLNETTLAVALPAMMAEYSITAATAQWLLTGFMLTMAVVLPATGWMLERFRTRSVFVFAAAAFLIGTVVAALAPSFPVLLLGRVAQAIGTAVIMPLLMTVAMTLVPPARRGSVMGMIAVVMAVGPALGPTVAGLILSVASWHAIFWFMVPLVLAAALLGTVLITDVGEQRSTPLDVVSVLLSVVAFGGLVFGLSSIGAIVEGGPAGRRALIVLGIGVVGLAAFVWRQLVRGRSGRALLDLRPLAVRNYTLPLLMLLILFGAMLGVLNTLPLYLQGSVLVTALTAGLVLLPGGLLEGVLSPIAGRFFDRHGPRPLVIPGMALVVGSLFWLATVDESSSVVVVVGVHIIFSVGLAMLFTPLMTTALGSLPAELYGHGSAILNTAQQLAGATGTALLISIYSGVSAADRLEGASETAALADGANSAFLVAAVAAVVALVLALFIRRNPTEASPSRTVVTVEQPGDPGAADD